MVTDKHAVIREDLRTADRVTGACAGDDGLALFARDDVRALLADHDQWRQQAQYETDVAQAACERVKEVEAERDGLRQQLEWTERYVLDSLKTNSRDMDDWRGDMRHIANSARAALAQEKS